MTTENLSITLADAKLPGRIISMQSEIGDTLADLCSKTAYDLSRLKGVGDNVIDDTRAILAFYGLSLSGDPACEAVEGAEHPIVAAYRTRLEANYPGMAAKLGTLSDREVGEEFGVSAQSVNNHRRMLGIAKAERVSRGSKKDRRIAALTAAIEEAVQLLTTPSAKGFEELLVDVEVVLTAALDTDTEAPAEESSDDAADDDSDDSEEAQAPADEGDEVDEVEAAADESSDDEADEADESDDESSDNGNVFQFGESDFDTTPQQDDDESDTKPVGGSLTFS